MAVLPFRRSSEVEVGLATEVTPCVADEVERKLRSRMNHLAGSWRFFIGRSPHDDRQWRMELLSGGGRQVWLFLASETQLAEHAYGLLEKYVRHASTRYSARQARRSSTAGI